jgi:hypothetical protein
MEFQTKYAAAHVAACSLRSRVFGKFFASTFTGSMFGAGPAIFAVWGYVIANVNDATVELNPPLLAAMIGTTAEDIQRAIDYLCSPDERSRTEAEDGRRLIKLGAFSYHVVNHASYLSIKNAEDRREQDRERKRKSREKSKKNKKTSKLTVSHGVSQNVTAGHSNSAASAYSDSDSDSDSDSKSKIKSVYKDSNSRSSNDAQHHYSAGFREFWNLYPRKVGKWKAWVAWQRDPPDIAVVVKTLGWQVNCDDWNRDEGKWTPHPTTYINQKRWEDEPQDPVKYVPDTRTREGRIMSGLRNITRDEHSQLTPLAKRLLDDGGKH